MHEMSRIIIILLVCTTTCQYLLCFILFITMRSQTVSISSMLLVCFGVLCKLYQCCLVQRLQVLKYNLSYVTDDSTVLSTVAALSKEQYNSIKEK